MAPADPPFSFGCWAEDTEHAEEQLLNAEPDADIVWVVQTDNVQEAYRNYWDAPAGFTDDEPCRYCGGECPNQPDGDVCDYYAGDIDGLYSSEE